MFAVPSALLGLTSLFGMGRGGSPTLSIALIRDRFLVDIVIKLRKSLFHSICKLFYVMSQRDFFLESLKVWFKAIDVQDISLAREEKLSGN